MLGGPDVLWGGVVPALLAATVFAAIWRLTGRAASAWRTALVVGYVAGQWALNARDFGATTLVRTGMLEKAGSGWAYDPRNLDFAAAIAKSGQPIEAHDWLPLLALLAIVPDAIACVAKIGPTVGRLLRIALCVFLPWRLVYGSKFWPLSLGEGFDFDLGGWSTTEATCWIAGMGGALVIAWEFACLASRDSQIANGGLQSAVVVIVTLGSAVTMLAAGSLHYAQLLAVLAAVLTACGVVSKFVAARRGPEAAAGPVIVVFGTLLAAGHFYAELGLSDAGFLLCAMVLGSGWLPLPAWISTRWQATIGVLLCLSVLTFPVGSAALGLARQVPKTETAGETQINPYQGFSP